MLPINPQPDLDPPTIVSMFLPQVRGTYVSSSAASFWGGAGDVMKSAMTFLNIPLKIVYACHNKTKHILFIFIYPPLSLLTGFIWNKRGLTLNSVTATGQGSFLRVLGENQTKKNQSDFKRLIKPSNTGGFDIKGWGGKQDEYTPSDPVMASLKAHQRRQMPPVVPRPKPNQTSVGPLGTAVHKRRQHLFSRDWGYCSGQTLPDKCFSYDKVTRISQMTQMQTSA